MKNKIIIEKLESINKKFNEINQRLIAPDVMSDVKKYIKLNKEYKGIEPVVKAYKKYKDLILNIESDKKILEEEKDEELRELAKIELDELEKKIETLEEEIKIMLLPSDPEDSKNAIIEIRAGTGGDEASLFAGDLFRMYSKYAENKGWKIEIVSFTEGTVGGYKEIITNIKGENVYGILKYESGVHRVQRIPQTETQGRVHTSAASVVVLPEAEEFDVEIKQDDIRIDRFCSSGPGGQSVNTTYSAIRITHIPTGIIVQCQDQKSQLKNLEKAMNELRTRIYDLEYQKRLNEVTSKRKTMISTGDRSAKIRTYNFPQNRLTDHRINFTAYNLQQILDGNLDDLIIKLQMAENAEKLKFNELNA